MRDEKQKENGYSHFTCDGPDIDDYARFLGCHMWDCDPRGPHRTEQICVERSLHLLHRDVCHWAFELKAQRIFSDFFPSHFVDELRTNARDARVIHQYINLPLVRYNLLDGRLYTLVARHLQCKFPYIRV